MNMRFRVLALALFLALPMTAAEAAGGGGNPMDQAGNNLALDPLAVSVFGDNHVRGLLAVDLSLDLLQVNRRKDIEKILPRLRDRYITSLTRFAANRVAIDRALDLEGMRRLLQDVTDDILGDQAARVLIGGASIRRL